MRFLGKILFATLALTLFTVSAFAGDWGEIRRADRNLNVRQKPTVNSEHVLTLKKGQQVKTDFLQENGWVAIFKISEDIRDESRALGYANGKYLSVVAQSEPLPGKTPEPVAPAPEKKTPSSAAGAMKPSAPAQGVGEVKSQVVSSPPAVEPTTAVPGVPVKITSERMTYDENKRIVSFIGNVVAHHEGLTMWADTISAYFMSSDKKNLKVDSIDRIVAKGNVRAEKGKTKGSCGKVTYQVADRILIMEDNPKLSDGPNSITGDVIRYYVKENRSEVVGNKGKRVEALFFTPKGLKVQ
ncbi:lipopolysaccharide transport periplasmic protein LptA [Salidesulfovibrio onnuriiensis]|uniref:lipopolysaccharide transport periplasmic protein LptA n=1 Tax=Salidesulfovibrio onnuriiensis TaxID=2583823 RepID=UPI0011CBAE66|nr:lipopolysaccharide transport periplasmic protein LptA [Salidesulfovibrio onnuriiensis]